MMMYTDDYAQQKGEKEEKRGKRILRKEERGKRMNI
jgi:hypothetical protein